VVFFYQRIVTGDETLFTGADAVVTSHQADDADAVATIHAAGARAFKYLDFYWYPGDRMFEGIDIGAHLDWAFCSTGSTPLVGRTLNDVNWYFLDANERPAREALFAYLETLKALGYDGIFADRGSASLNGPPGALPWKASTCTGDPVSTKRRRFADVYVNVLRQVSRTVGLRILLNYGHPYTGVRLRPNPSNPHCRGVGSHAKCTYRSDIWKWIDQDVDEHRVGLTGPGSFDADYDLGRIAERHVSPAGVSRVIREVKTTTRNKNRVYYHWARIRLFQVAMFVNTGDDRCVTSTRPGPCFHQGTYPLLTRARLGRPLGPRPVGLSCRSRSPTSCVWLRRYARGMTVLNPSHRPRRLRDVPMRASGCREIEDLYHSTLSASAFLAGGRCTDTLSYLMPPLSGRVLMYHRPVPGSQAGGEPAAPERLYPCVAAACGDAPWR